MSYNYKPLDVFKELKIVFDLFDEFRADPSKPKLLKELEFLHRKMVIILFKENVPKSLIITLVQFFTLNDEVESFEAPSNEMLKYHVLLTTEIHKIVQNPDVKEHESELLLLFIKYDFNKPAICNYYCEYIKTLQTEKPELANVYIELIELARSNFKIEHSYSLDNESLSDTILATLNQQKIIRIF